MSDLDSEPIVIVPYSDQWPSHFERESDRLADVLPDATIEHVGSTAVPGLPAKPIIDILVGATRIAQVEDAIPAIERLGYEYVAAFEAALPERRYFRRVRAGRRTHHVHAVELETEFWRRHLAFRNILRRDPESARRYTELKMYLATEFSHDHEAYTEGKSSLIAEILAAHDDDHGATPDRTAI